MSPVPQDAPQDAQVLDDIVSPAQGSQGDSVDCDVTPIRRPTGCDRAKSSTKKDSSFKEVLSLMEEKENSSQSFISSELKDVKVTMANIGAYTNVLMQKEMLILEKSKLEVEKMKLEVDKLRLENKNLE